MCIRDSLIGIDRDQTAIDAAQERLAPYLDRVTLVHSNFDQMCIRDSLPAAHLKVMVQRRHFENALAVGELEIRHLDDVGQRLTDVNDTHQQQHQRHVVGEGQCRHRAAQKQGAGVAHEHLGGVAVIHQKTAQAAQHGGGRCV